MVDGYLRPSHGLRIFGTTDSDTRLKRENDWIFYAADSLLPVLPFLAFAFHFSADSECRQVEIQRY